MLLASGLYRLFVQGGYYKSSIKHLRKQGIQLGSIIQSLIQEFLYHRPEYQAVIKHWREQILINPLQGCFINVNGHEIYLGLYFIAIAFLNHDNFTLPIGEWLKKKYQCPDNKISQDQQLTVHNENFGTHANQFVFRISFQTMEYKSYSSLNDMLLQFTQFKNSGNIFRAQKKLFGLINTEYS
jgi:hypothetical protein